MANKKNISSTDILTLYMDYVVKHGVKPTDISDFCNRINVKESDFYEHFKTLKKVEKAVFKTLFLNSLEVGVEIPGVAATVYFTAVLKNGLKTLFQC